MTFLYKLDLYSPKDKPADENELSRSKHSKVVIFRKNRRTDSAEISTSTSSRSGRQNFLPPSSVTCSIIYASADEKMDRANTGGLYCTATECVVRTGSPEGSTLLDVGSSGQTDRTW